MPKQTLQISIIPEIIPGLLTDVDLIYEFGYLTKDGFTISTEPMSAGMRSRGWILLKCNILNTKMLQKKRTK